MARKLDLAQLRRAKNNQYKPGDQTDLEVVEKKEAVKPVPKKEQKKVRPKTVKLEANNQPIVEKKVGRPVEKDKKPTKATSIRVHPDLIEVPKILAGISRKNVFSMYNEIIVDALIKYKKKYPGILNDLVIPPKEEL